MNYDELEKLNEKFAKESKEFIGEFHILFRKWMKKSPRMTAINVFHLPINMFLNSVCEMENSAELFPDMVDVYIRMIAPFVRLKNEWGKIPNKAFAKRYAELYQSQFNERFDSEEDREQFKKWFEGKREKAHENRAD